MREDDLQISNKGLKKRKNLKPATGKPGGDERGGRGMAMNIGGVIKKARSELSELTGLPLSSTLKTVKDNKGWRVLIEMVEKRAIPDGMDVLATYEALLDEDGNLLEFSRKGMRNRMETVAED